MKKIKYSLLSLLAVLGMASCSNDYEYTAAEKLSNAQVYFPNDMAQTANVTMEDSTFTFELARVNTADELTVNFEIANDSLLELPKSVKFAAGADKVTISGKAKVSEMGYDAPQQFTMAITDAEYTTPYGVSTLVATVNCPAPWTTLGKGKMRDNFIHGDYFTVVIQQNDLDPNLFRVVDPYSAMLEDGGYVPGYVKAGPADYLVMELVSAKSIKAALAGISRDFVYFDYIRTGYYLSNYDDGESSDGEVYAVNPYSFTSLRTDAGVQYNKVVGYQDNGLPGEIELAPYYYIFGLGGWNYTQKEGTIDIIFPGYTPLDLSASIDYVGLFTDKAGATYASCEIGLGTDVDDARAIVMPQDADANAVADAIAAGELEAQSVTAGRNDVAFNADELDANKLQVVLAVILNGEVKAVATTNFEYFGGGASNPWKSLGIGLYSDDAILPMFTQDEEGTPFEPIEYEVEIFESTENPGLYRVMDPYAVGVYPYGSAFVNAGFKMPAAGELYLEVNATDPEAVYIATQDLGIDFGDGAIGILTNAYRYMANYDVATLKEYGYFGIAQDGYIAFPSFYINRDNHDEGVFQGILTEAGELAYYCGMNSKIQVTLPSAVSSVKMEAVRKQANITRWNSMMDLKLNMKAFEKQNGKKCNSAEHKLGFKKQSMNVEKVRF